MVNSKMKNNKSSKNNKNSKSSKNSNNTNGNSGVKRKTEEVIACLAGKKSGAESIFCPILCVVKWVIAIIALLAVFVWMLLDDNSFIDGNGNVLLSDFLKGMLKIGANLEVALVLFIGILAAFTASFICVPGYGSDKGGRYFKLLPALPLILLILFAVCFPVFFRSGGVFEGSDLDMTSDGEPLSFDSFIAGCECAGSLLLLSLLFAGILYILLKRRAYAVFYRWSGMNAAIAGGCFAYVFVYFQHSFGEYDRYGDYGFWHFWLWHIIPLLLVALLGAVFGRICFQRGFFKKL